MDWFFRIPGAMKCSVKSQRIAKLAFRNEVNIMKLGYDSLNERRTLLVRCIDRRYYSTGPQKIQENKVIKRQIWMPSIFLRDYSGKIHYDDTECEDKSIWSKYVPLDYHKTELHERNVKIDQLNELVGQQKTELKNTEEALLRATALLFARSKIEILESMHMVNMQQDPTSINLKDSVRREVDKHFNNWKLIIATKKNDPAVQRMLQVLIRERIEEDVFCERIAALQTSISVPIHLPNVTIPSYAFSKIIKALESMNLVDAETLKCLHAIDALSGL